MKAIKKNLLAYFKDGDLSKEIFCLKQLIGYATITGETSLILISAWLNLIEAVINFKKIKYIYNNKRFLH